MPEWSENFSNRTLQEVLRTKDDNRAWSKELRVGMNAVLDKKLAKKISLEEYAANRRHFKDEMAECLRRSTILAQEITIRIWQDRRLAGKIAFRPTT
jgi:hypothetical protein